MAELTMRVVAVIAGLLAMPAAAQDISSSWTSTQMLLNAEKDAWAAPECVKEGEWAVDCGDAPETRKATTSAPTPAIDLTYTPSPALRRRNLATFVEKVRASDPAGAAGLEAEFAKGDVMDRIGQEMAPMGLRVDNVADAMAAYIDEAWPAVSGQKLPPSRTRAQALKRQMERAAGATEALRGATNATKQEMAESLLIQAALVASAAEQARASGDRNQMTAMAAVAAQGAQAMLGIDLRTMSLTEQGLVAVTD